MDDQNPKAAVRLTYVGSTTITVEWDKAIGYIERYDVSGYNAELETKKNLNNLTPEKHYNILVKYLLKDTQEWIVLGSASATTRALNPPVTNLNIVNTGTDEATLEWDHVIANLPAKDYAIRPAGVSTYTYISDNHITVTGNSGTQQTYEVFWRNFIWEKSAPAFITVKFGDYTVPTTPTNLSITAESSRVTLNWQASSDNIGVIGYKITGSHLSEIITPRTTFTTSELPHATLLTFYVTALDGADNESSPAEISITLPDVSTPPPPGNLQAQMISATQLKLTWEPATDSFAVMGYEVLRNGVLLTRVTGTELTLPVITGREYIFQVIAYDEAENRSSPAVLTYTPYDVFFPDTDHLNDATDPSSSVAKQTGGSIDKEHGIVKLQTTHSALSEFIIDNDEAKQKATAQFEAIYVSARTARLSWPATADVYLCKTTPSSVREYVGPDTHYTHWGLPPGQPVKAELLRLLPNNATQPLATTSFSMGAVSPPAPPTNLRATYITETTATLAWQPPPNSRYPVFGYKVDYKTNQREDPNSGTTNELTYTATGLRSGTRYLFSVSAENIDGDHSSPTTIELTTPDLTAPTSPQNLRAQAINSNTVKLTWVRSTDNTAVVGYEVWRNGVLLSKATENEYSLSITLGREYTFEVIAYDRTGNRSSPATLVYTPLDDMPPVAPPFMEAEAIDVTRTTAKLIWSPFDTDQRVVTYQVTREDDEVFIENVKGTLFVATNLVPGKKDVFTIRAGDASGNLSDPFSITVTGRA